MMNASYQVHRRVGQLCWSSAAYNKDDTPRFSVISLVEYVHDRRPGVLELLSCGVAESELECIELARCIPKETLPMLLIDVGLLLFDEELTQVFARSCHPDGHFIRLESSVGVSILLTSLGSVSYNATPWPPSGPNWQPPDTSHIQADNVVRMPIYKNAFEDDYLVYTAERELLVDKEFWHEHAARFGLLGWFECNSIIVDRDEQ